MVPIVTPGPCHQICTAMVPFMVLLFIITLVVSITQMPVVMITLRYMHYQNDLNSFIFNLFWPNNIDP